MTVFHNPALSEESRHQAAKIIPTIQRESLLNWLESSGRLHSTEATEFQDHKMPDSLDDIIETELYPPEDDEEEMD